jgi:hypothetical protein
MIENRAGKRVFLFFIAVPHFYTLLLLINGLDNHIILPERRQAVAAFSTSYMGLTRSGFQSSGSP